MKEYNKDLLNHINKTDFSGVVSIREKGNVLFEHVSGMRDKANQLPITIDTKFGIASGTKLFTALGIMCLVEQGTISLSDPINNYIPYDFPTYDSSVTIFHLLTHTSGLPDYFDEDEEQIPLSVPWYELHKPTDYLPIMPQKPMKFTPGTSFNYNNSGFVFLAMIIEYMTGDYYRFIEQEVLQKAGMNDSGFYKMNELPENTALGYVDPLNYPHKTNIFDLPIIGGGDGGLFVTARDMHRFWNALLEGNIVSKETLKEILYPHAKATSLQYGLGIWLRNSHNIHIPHIVGQDPGISFESGYDPRSLQTYVLVSNTEHGVWPISKLLQQS